MNSNSVVEIKKSSGFCVCNFTEDKTGPVMETFDLDLDSDTLTLQFSETVNVSTLLITGFTLSNSSTAKYTFKEGAIQPENSHIVAVNMTALDLNEIKRLTSLAISKETSYLSALAGSVKDMNGNNLISVQNLFVSKYTKDESAPTLVAFDLAMRGGVRHLLSY